MVVHSIVNIILSVSLISTFIGVFFFTYGNRVEEAIVQDQSAFLAKELSRDMKVLIPKQVRENIAKKMTPPNLAKEDKEAAEYNSLLKQKATNILGILFIIGVSLSWVICEWKNISFLSVLKENSIILVFIAITEFIFLTFIGQNVIIADPKYVRAYLVDALQKKFPKKLITIPPWITDLPIRI